MPLEFVTTPAPIPQPTSAVLNWHWGRPLTVWRKTFVLLRDGREVGGSWQAYRLTSWRDLQALARTYDLPPVASADWSIECADCSREGD
jgi:hypothetical protein